MRRVVLLVAFVLVLESLAPWTEASAAVVTKRMPSDIAGVALIISCASGPIAADYAAETASGVALTGPYAVTRGADKWLVSLMNDGGRRVKKYVIPHQTIRAIVSIKYDMTVLERIDLVFTARHLALIHTSLANAGIFTVSDVYELPLGRSSEVDRTLLKGDPDLMKELNIGLAAYRLGAGRCVAK